MGVTKISLSFSWSSDSNQSKYRNITPILFLAAFKFSEFCATTFCPLMVSSLNIHSFPLGYCVSETECSGFQYVTAIITWVISWYLPYLYIMASLLFIWRVPILNRGTKRQETKREEPEQENNYEHNFILEIIVFCWSLFFRDHLFLA